MSLYKCFYILIFIVCVFVNISASDSVYSINVNHNGQTCDAFEELINKKCVLGLPFAELLLNCSGDGIDPANLQWVIKDSKENTTQKVGSTDSVEVSGPELKFKKLDAIIHSGFYQCIFVGTNESKPLSFDVQLYVSPYVNNVTNKSITIVEGNKLKLQCPVTTAVPTRIVWHLNTSANPNKTLMINDDRVIFENSSDIISSSTLIINSVNMTLDRGVYSCYAESKFGNSSYATFFFIRVKSGRAALWPFLGICAQVLILCIIILIYEKRRDKTRMDESDTDQGPEIKS